jgi:transcriptional regulator with XRE-family HTH domain
VAVAAPEPVGQPAERTDAGLTRSELLAAAGVREADIAELESHGLLPRPTHGRDQLLYDDDAAAVARLAAAFAVHGIEPRHLKMYKHFAEREAALFEQIVMALVRQRNPEARGQAQQTVAELAGLGRELRTIMLRAALQGAFDAR